MHTLNIRISLLRGLSQIHQRLVYDSSRTRYTERMHHWRKNIESHLKGQVSFKMIVSMRLGMCNLTSVGLCRL